MSNEFLSQDEVDALLKGVNGEVDAPEEEPPKDGVRPYNLATQERIVRGRMPTLEIITISSRFQVLDLRSVMIKIGSDQRKSGRKPV